MRLLSVSNATVLNADGKCIECLIQKNKKNKKLQVVQSNFFWK